MRPTEMLRQENLQDWEAVAGHEFCQLLAAGSLPEDKMRWYLVQDYKFIEGFVRLLAAAISHAPSLADALPGARFLGLVSSTENTYFLRSFAALETSEAQLNAPAAPATAGFQELMQAARLSGRYEQMLAVLVVAEWSYLSWAESFVDYADDLPFWFAEWIDLHSGDGFEGVVAYLRGQLDQCWEGLSDAERQEAAQMFQKAVQLERAFFDAALAAPRG